jgi:hypothetical protein
MSHLFDQPWRKGSNLSRDLSYTQGMKQAREMAPTLPPGPADEAALEHAKKLASEGDGSAAFFAIAERHARQAGLR